MDDLDMAWAAGFLEGEGSFMLWKGRYPRVKASQVDREPLERLQALFGGTIHKDGRPERTFSTSQVWYWSVFGTKAEMVCLAVQPYIKSSRRLEQIRHAMSGVPVPA